MSATLVIALLLSLVVIFSQFGGTISATSAWQWWMVGVFLIAAAVNPEIFRSVANLFGIKFISNFVLATLVMFLFVQGLNAQSSLSQLARRQRKIISSAAIESYRQRNLQKSGILDRSHFSSDQSKIDVLIILPTYNEEENVSLIYSDLLALKKRTQNLHFCFVNDGSTDGTQKFLHSIPSEYFVDHLSNIGVSGVLQTGFELACMLNAIHVIQCDSDGQHPIAEIPNLLSAARSTQADCVIGSRFTNGSSYDHFSNKSTSFLRILGGYSLRIALRALFSAKVSDPTSGFRIYSRQAVSVLRHNLPDDYPEPESIAILASRGFKISELQIDMHPRLSGKSSLSGTRSVAYMSKVISALIGLRIRLMMKIA